MDLYQSTHWGDAEDGNKIRISDMTPRHAFNCTRWLERHAKVIAFRDSCRWLDIGSWIGGEQALYDLDCAIAADEEEKQDPDKWIKSTRLYQALDKRAESYEPTLMEMM